MFSFFKKSANLKAAIAAVNKDGSVANNRAFQAALANSVLYVAAQNVPENWRGTIVLQQEITLPVLTSEAPGGGVALLCFSEVAEVKSRTGSESCFGLRLQGINELVERHGYAGIIVNPSGPWAGLSASDLRSLVSKI
jgi:hypothetical protein